MPSIGSITKTVDTVAKGVVTGFGSEDLINNKLFQQAAGAAIGFAVGGGFQGAALGMQIVGGAQSVRAQKKAADAQVKRNAVLRRQAEVRAARNRAQLVRQARIAQAQVSAQASASGRAGSSAAAGASSGISQQVGSNFAFTSQIQQLGDAAQGFENEIGSILTDASQTSAFASIGASVFDFIGERQSLKTKSVT